MKKSLIILFFCLFTGILMYAHAPYIAGRWDVSNGSSLNIQQKKIAGLGVVSNAINWSGSDRNFLYSASGKWNSIGYFEVNVQRESRLNGCITFLFMVIKINSGNKTGTLEESAKDNRCDLRIGYKSKFTIKKR